MAIIWQFTEGQTNYQVRSAGATLRLYTNGAFHSQYNPNHLFTGGIWDLLAVPAFYSGTFCSSAFYTSPSASKTVYPGNRQETDAAQTAPTLSGSGQNLLVLGVGGGAVIHLFNELFDYPATTGIEYDRNHLRVANRFFKCGTPNTRLIHADAYQWIKESVTQFSVVIDDLFVDGPDDPVRPRAVNRQWMKKLDLQLKHDGLLIQNHLSPVTARSVANDSWVQDHFQSALLFHHPNYANGILALYKDSVDIRSGRKQLQKRLSDHPASSLKRLKFRVETVF